MLTMSSDVASMSAGNVAGPEHGRLCETQQVDRENMVWPRCDLHLTTGKVGLSSLETQVFAF